MKLLFIECNMGAAGDMLAAALSEVIEEQEEFENEMARLKLDGISIKCLHTKSCGIAGTHMQIQIDGKMEEEALVHRHDDGLDIVHKEGIDHSGHIHISLEKIEKFIAQIDVNEKVKQDMKAVYRIIAEAESKVHGMPVEKVHFHEVGMLDAIADILAVCWLIDKIQPDKIISTPICTGSGRVRCSHGIMPVPAPATAEILRGIPCYAGVLKGELCTPTGAALLKYFADDFTEMPLMKTEKIGIGIGTKQFEAANVVRVFLGCNE